MIRSLRMRLFLGVTAVSALILGILAIGIEEALRHTLKHEFDRVLLAKARSLASMVELTGDNIHFDYQASQFPEFAAGSHRAYFEILLDGVPAHHSDSLGEAHLTASPPDETDGEATSFTLPDGRRGRLLAIPFSPLLDDEGKSPPPNRKIPAGVLLVAQDSDDLDHTVNRLVLMTVSFCGVATLLSGVALIGVVGRAIRPVDKLARQIESLRETDLATPLEIRDLPSELAPVVDRLNGLLGRLDAAFVRERAFTADVAHELRTPLAGLLATLEVARTRPRDAAGYESAIDKSLAILGQMQGLVENLLLLARADSGQLKMRTDPVDVEVLLEESRLPFERAAAARQLSFSIHAEGSAQAVGDRDFLRVIVNNLFDNAVSYAAPASTIEARIYSADDRLMIQIANESRGLTSIDLPRLFERFNRKDASRSATGIHAGLGLGICRRLAELQDGTIGLRLEGDRFIVTVDLPVSSSFHDAPV